MPTIIGPVKLGRNLTKKEEEDFIRKFEQSGAKIKLPFKATGFKSTKKLELPSDIENFLPIEEVEKVEEVVEKTEDKLLDNYLDQNASTVKKALSEDDFDDETLEALYELEEMGKGRSSVLNKINKLLERE